MSTSTIGLFVRHLAVSEEAKRLRDNSDRDLLAAYQSERSEAAFTELMRRYEALVLRTCCRVLGPGPDAEDAFQATFILLARKARQPGREAAGAVSLGGWLHRVAYQTALNARIGTTRRKTHEQQANVMAMRPTSCSDPAVQATWNEVQPILDAEMDALPEQARKLLIACYLQEKTYTEVAAELGLPRGSIAWHLQRARTLLAARLGRRGITVSALLLSVLLEDAAKGAGVPATLRVHTVEAARTFTEQATGIVSENIARLVKGGLAQMAKSWTYLSMAVAGWIGLLGAGLIVCQTLKAWPDQKPESEPPAAAERPAQEGDKSARTDRYGDPLPPDALARLGTTRLRHAHAASYVLFAPDGKTVASGGADDSVCLWDMATGKLVHSLKHPRSGLRPLACSRDGKTLVSAVSDRGLPAHLWLWDVRTGEQLRKIELGRHQSRVAISADTKMVASVETSGVGDTVVRLWDVASGKPLRALEGERKGIHFLSFSPDNKTLVAVAGNEKVMQLWDLASGKLLHELEHPGMTSTVSFSPDGKTLASGSTVRDRTIRLWDVATGKLLHTLQGHQQGIASLAFSPDGKVLASGSGERDRTIRLWDVTTGKEVRKLKAGQCLLISSLSFSPDGKVLASGSHGPAVRLWDVRTGEELHRPQGAHTGWVHSVSFAPDGRTLATAAVLGEGEGTVRLWDVTSGKALAQLQQPGKAHTVGSPPAADHAVAFAPDGKTLVSGGAGVVRIWERTTGKRLRELEAPGGSPQAFSPDGKLLAAGSREGRNWSLLLWDVASGTQLRELVHGSYASSVVFSPDGKTLAVGMVGGSVHLWDVGTGQKLLELAKGWSEITALAFAPDGKTLAVGGYDHKIHLLAVSSGKELRTLTGHSDTVFALTFSPSGRLLASASWDRTVRLWEVQAGQVAECHQFRGHEAWVMSVAFSPDSRRLASGSCDSTALVWDVTGRLDNGRLRPAQFSATELDRLWADLASEDAGEAHRALWALAAAPTQVLPLLQKQLRPDPAVDPEAVDRLIARLDDDSFAVRQKVLSELKKLGERVEPALRRALEQKSSLEVRRSLEELLSKPKGSLPGDVLRVLRAVELLEQMGTAEARRVLEGLSRGGPDVRQREAQSALRRLDRK